MPKSRKRKTGKGGISSRHTYSSNKKVQKKTKRIQIAAIAVLIIAGLAIAAAIYMNSGDGGGSSSAGEEITTASGLKYIDIVPGTGETPSMGQTVTVHYTGTLENGKKFDSSVDKGQPYTFTLGRDPVIQGWVEGLTSMKAGGKRKLIIPPDLAYGATGRPGIPPNATLLFDVELLSVK